MSAGNRPGPARNRSRSKEDRRLFLPLGEVAEMLDVSRSTVFRAHEAGEFPMLKMRGAYRVPRGFVEGLVAACVPGRLVVVEEYAAAWADAMTTASEAVA